MSSFPHRLNLSAAAALCAAACALCPAVSAAPGPLRGTCSCAAPQASVAAYGWPLRPFHAQHPVRGFFGDPRIGRARDGSVIRSFHFGIDIAGADGTPVYATLTGRVRGGAAAHDVVAIAGAGGRVFAYWHVVPAVHRGQHVVAYRTLIGHIASGWGHVHFAEYSFGTPLNPLRPGALGPYRDATPPRITGLGIAWEGLAVAPRAPLSGRVDLVVSAYDAPPVPVGGAWSTLTAAPELVRWRIDGGRWSTALDFRRIVPRPDGYDAVYAYHTHQNRPHRRGNYLIYLTHGWDAGSIASGRHTLEAVACDIRGNCTTFSTGFASLRAAT
jgi:hypothetical protein